MILYNTMTLSKNSSPNINFTMFRSINGPPAFVSNAFHGRSPGPNFGWKTVQTSRSPGAEWAWLGRLGAIGLSSGRHVYQSCIQHHSTQFGPIGWITIFLGDSLFWFKALKASRSCWKPGLQWFVLGFNLLESGRMNAWTMFMRIILKQASLNLWKWFKSSKPTVPAVTKIITMKPFESAKTCRNHSLISAERFSPRIQLNRELHKRQGLIEAITQGQILQVI